MFIIEGHHYSHQKASGVSLVELIIFIVIVSVGIAGILMTMNEVTRHSADPMIRKQSLAIAESLLEEVQLMPFTFCDPNDARVEEATASTTAECIGVGVESMGPEGEGRYAAPQFDNVSDYAGFTMNAGNGGIRDIHNTQIPALNGYSAEIRISSPGLAGIAASETLLIAVTVTGPDNVPLTLEGFRTRYAPNSPP